MSNLPPPPPKKKPGPKPKAAAEPVPQEPTPSPPPPPDLTIGGLYAAAIVQTEIVRSVYRMQFTGEAPPKDLTRACGELASTIDEMLDKVAAKLKTPYAPPL